jgi:hypothetical protein
LLLLLLRRSLMVSQETIETNKRKWPYVVLIPKEEEMHMMMMRMRS